MLGQDGGRGVVFRWRRWRDRGRGLVRGGVLPRLFGLFLLSGGELRRTFWGILGLDLKMEKLDLRCDGFAEVLPRALRVIYFRCKLATPFRLFEHFKSQNPNHKLK